jgi:predicted nucleotidyltransferase
MFTKEERDYIRSRVLDMARSDPRVTAGALTGSAAAGAEDEWSDIDLSFGIAEGVDLQALLDEWTEALDREFGVLHHWDLPFRSSIYRVFLISMGMQVDVAVTPQAEFGAYGPTFRPLFGESRRLEPPPKPDPSNRIGWAWHHVLHARSCIERGKYWQAEYWIGELRDETLVLACLRLGVEASYARGIHRLPAAVTEPLEAALVRALDAAELRRALAAATACFMDELELWNHHLCERLKPILQKYGAQQSITERDNTSQESLWTS